MFRELFETKENRVQKCATKTRKQRLSCASTREAIIKLVLASSRCAMAGPSCSNQISSNVNSAVPGACKSAGWPSASCWQGTSASACVLHAADRSVYSDAQTSNWLTRDMHPYSIATNRRWFRCSEAASETEGNGTALAGSASCKYAISSTTPSV